MANFIQKKLQVFVSSTYEDLKVERQAAVSAILSSGHIPAGMELFTAGDESQMEVIKQWIDESDIFMLILGGRYGSLEPTSGKSYTHLEYEYALSKNKPLFACVIGDSAIEPRVKAHGSVAIETANSDKLKEFRSVVLGKLSKFWEDAKDIKIVVTETLAHLSRREDLVGWIRPAEQAEMAPLLNELTRLSKENSRLREQAESVADTRQYGGLAYAELKRLLEASGALKYFVDHRPVWKSSRGGGQLTGSPHIAELFSRGLLSRMGSSSYRLTDNGRSFLNRLDLDDLDEGPSQE